MRIRRTVQKLSERSSQGLEKRTYTISASPNVFKTFERLLRHLQYCAGVGHSATVAMAIDGDGADRFNVESPELPKLEDGDVRDSKGGVEIVRYSD